MKKIALLTLTLIVMGSFYGCGNSAKENPNENNQISNEEQSSKKDNNDISSVEDNLYEVEIISLTDTKVTLNIISEADENEAPIEESDVAADVIGMAKYVPYDNSNAVTLKLDKNLEIKDSAGNDFPPYLLSNGTFLKVLIKDNTVIKMLVE